MGYLRADRHALVGGAQDGVTVGHSAVQPGALRVSDPPPKRDGVAVDGRQITRELVVVDGLAVTDRTIATVRARGMGVIDLRGRLPVNSTPPSTTASSPTAWLRLSTTRAATRSAVYEVKERGGFPGVARDVWYRLHVHGPYGKGTNLDLHPYVPKGASVLFLPSGKVVVRCLGRDERDD